ncbi:Mpv17 / PMP22 family protein [Nitzschia inconspicua]|uniref:Mpv17 / PMP22 family protein n=1 Tax=Nitzschia inconspicua TaxID=303405 RepID=A0A9K3PDN9_9STRA|nr:Mpv17 / PMP22 family protein [Nitzschia inconspicua]
MQTMYAKVSMFWIPILGITIGLVVATSFSPFEWYIRQLELFPVQTKAITTGCIQFWGDLAAQYYESRRKRKSKNTKDSTFKYNLRRGMSLSADGMLLSGPLLHYCFEAMETYLPTEGDGNVMVTLTHVLINDYIIDSVYIALSFAFTSLAEGYSLLELVRIFRNDFWATVSASWCTSLAFTPIEFVCFGYLPLHFRVLFMNFVDLVWGAIISFFSHRSRRHASGEEVPT